MTETSGDVETLVPPRDELGPEVSARLAQTVARAVGAKPFPASARRLQELTQDPKVRIEAVLEVVDGDPALSERLLRLVNSAGYGLKIPCTSARHAAVLVGIRRLHRVATTGAVLDLFQSQHAQAGEILLHAAVVASLCRHLAVHLGLPHDELFTLGFLHDIGKLVLLDQEREAYVPLLEQFGKEPDSIHEHERRLFGFDHSELGARVLRAWNIPEPIPSAVARHHDRARGAFHDLASLQVQTLRLADRLAYHLPLTAERGARLVAESEAARLLQVSESQLLAMWSDLQTLRDRSRMRARGEPEFETVPPNLEVPTSLRPRESSLRPPDESTLLSTLRTRSLDSIEPMAATAKERSALGVVFGLCSAAAAAVAYGLVSEGGSPAPELALASGVLLALVAVPFCFRAGVLPSRRQREP